MIDELKKLRELTKTLTENGYLRDQAEEWEYALDAIPDCIYIINIDFEIKFVNRALAKRLGKTKQELYNKICYKEIREYKSEYPISTNCSECDDYVNKPSLKEIFIRNLDGWFDITRSPIYTKDNELIGFICVLQDVTAKRKALANVCEQIELNTKIRSSEAKFKAIFEVNRCVITVVRLDTDQLVDVNPSFEYYTGYKKEEVLGKKMDDLGFWVDVNQRKKFRSNLTMDGIVEELEVDFKNRSGEVKQGKISSSVVFIEGVPHSVSIITKR